MKDPEAKGASTTCSCALVVRILFVALLISAGGVWLLVKWRPHYVLGAVDAPPAPVVEVTPPKLLVAPVVFDCANRKPGVCPALPADNDKLKSWGGAVLCDAPWLSGLGHAEYYRTVPTYVKSITDAATVGKRPFMIDVGVNVGVIAVAAASQGLRVLGFEPVPLNLRISSESACANADSVVPHLTLVPSAAGAKTVPEGVTIFVAHRADNTAMSAEAATAHVGGKTEAIQVPLVAIDDWIASAPPGEFSAADLVWFKVDVQGYESFVFEGAEKLLRSATHPLFRITCEDDAGLTGRIKGAKTASEVLKAWGFVATHMKHEPDPSWINPQYYKGART